MKKITILNAYGDKNIGDAAILHMAISLINEANNKQCHIAVLCEDNSSFSNFIQPGPNSTPYQLPYGYAINGKKKRVGTTTKVTRFIEIFVKSYGFILMNKLFNKPLPKDGFYTYIYQITNADLIVGMGGGYLTTNDKYKDYFGLGLTLLPIHIAKLYKKKQVLLPMSFGPFASYSQKKLTYKALSGTVVISRDHITLNELKKIDKKRRLATYYSPDLALFFKIKEVPITFQDRTEGVSKMSTNIIKEAMYGVWKMRRF